MNYEVFFQGKPVVVSSPLGMNVDNQFLGGPVELSALCDTGDGTQTYTLKYTGGLTYYIDVREFDDGVALPIPGYGMPDEFVYDFCKRWEKQSRQGRDGIYQ